MFSPTPLSLFLYPYPFIHILLSLSFYSNPFTPISLSLSLYHFRFIPIPLSQSLNPYSFIPIPLSHVIPFQTFFAHIWEIYYWNFERFIKNALTRSLFELEKCYFWLGRSLNNPLGHQWWLIIHIVGINEWHCLGCALVLHSLHPYLPHKMSTKLINTIITLINISYEWISPAMSM